MIRKFGFRNFSSFRDGAEISFVGKDSLEYDSEQIEGVSSVIGIKGANGSGKTNILKAISFLYCFCSKRVVTTKSSESGISEIEIPIQSFMNNLECTEFYIEFSHGNLIYYYELDITIKGIQREELRRKNKKEITCITREKNKITHCLNEFSEITKLKLRSDQSIVSVVQDFDFSNPMIDLNEVNLMFQRIIFNVGYDGYKTIETENFFYSSEFYHNNPESL